MSRRCVIKAVLFDGVDPNQLPIAALHAAALQLMTQFVAHPTAALAETISALLEAIGSHAEAYRAPRGHDLYACAAAAWAHFRDQLSQDGAQRVH